MTPTIPEKDFIVEPAWLTAAREKGLVTGEQGCGLVATAPKRLKRVTEWTTLGCQWCPDEGWIEFTLPLRLQPTTNGGAFKKWQIGVASKHRREVTKRMAANIRTLMPFIELAQNGQAIDCLITRIGRQMDDDNVQGCCKMVRDAVALYLGVGDGPKDPIRWSYAQEVRMVYGTKIRLSVPKIELRIKETT